jgi:hypothetical protein
VSGNKKIKNMDRRSRHIRWTKTGVKRSLGHTQQKNRRNRRKILRRKEWNNDEQTNVGHGGNRTK